MRSATPSDPPTPTAVPDSTNAGPAQTLSLLGQQAPRAGSTELEWVPSKEPVSTPTPVPTSGETIAGYEILGELGRGGMGVVYKARQVALKRLVALKMIHHAGSAAERLRFQQEAEAVARLQHPNIVQIYEVGEDQGRPFFSLEFIDGGSLEAQIDHKPQPPETAAILVETLARAMHVAHRAGIVHRDLKPANVLLKTTEDTEDTEKRPKGATSGLSSVSSVSSVVKITDFGLAKQLEGDANQTVAGAVMGTPSYMAPEQAEGRNADVGPAADVYALGAILYEMLTGRPPIMGPTPWITVGLVPIVEPVPPRQMQPKVPRDLEIICLKCLEKDPKKRYLSAEDLADDLRRHLDHEPIRARPTPFHERARKWLRRHPARAVGLVLAAVVLLGAFYSQSREARLATERLQRLERYRDAESKRESAQQVVARAVDTKDPQSWEQAERLSAEALAHLGTDLEAAALRSDLETLRADAAQGIAWRERFRKLRRDHFEASLHETPIAGVEDSRQKMLAAAVNGLKRFDITRGAGSCVPEVPARYFAESERAQVRILCRGLVLLLAEAEARAQPNDGDAEKQKRLQHALAVLDWAAGAWPPTRSYQLQKADYLKKLGRDAEAVEAERAAPAEPVDVLDHFRLGVAHFDANRVDSAMQEFTTVLSLEPLHFWSHYRLALCRIRLAEEAADSTSTRPLWEAAETSLSVCLKEQDRFGWGLVLRGHVRSQLGQWKQAEEDLSSAQRLADDSLRYSVLVERGLLLYRKGSLDAAAPVLEEAKKQWPARVPAYTVLGLVYAKQEKRPAAIAVLGEALERAPNNPGVYRSRVALHKEERHWQEALQDVDAALRHESPENTWRLAADHVERAHLLQHLMQTREAVQAYADAVRARPGFALAYHERGLLLERLGDANRDLNGRWQDYDEALASLNQWAAREKPDAEFHQVRARIQRKLVPLLSKALNVARAGGPKQAAEADELQTRLQVLLQGIVADHGRSLDLKPDDAATHDKRGWDLLLLLEAPKLALPDFKQAIDLRKKTNHPKASDYVGRGLCRAQLGEWRSAVKDADTALELTPEKEKDRELAFLKYNIARIFGQAAKDVAQEIAANPANDLRKTKAQCEDRALKHLQEALNSLDERDRSAFWLDTARIEPALATLRTLPEYKKLDEKYGKR